MTSLAMRHRKAAVSRHPERIGIDYINVLNTGEDYKLFLYFIPSPGLPNTETIPTIAPENIRISDSEENKVLSDLLIKEVIKGKWEQRIEPIIDSALRFDGKTKIKCGTKINLIDRSFSVEFWAKRESTKKHHIIIGQGPTGTNSSLTIGFKDSDCFTFGFYNNDLNTENIGTDSGWHHWACVYNAAPRKQIVYRDGEKVAERFANGHYQGSGVLYLGRSSRGTLFFNIHVEEAQDNVRIWNRARTEALSDGFSTTGEDHFHGDLAEVRIWYKARTQAEIVADMYHRITGKEDHLGSYWVAPDEKTATLPDRSGHGNNGTCPDNLLLRMTQPPLPPGYMARQTGSRVDLYRQGNVVTITLPREQKVLREKEVHRYKLELSDIELDPFFSHITFSLDEGNEFDPQPLRPIERTTVKAPEIDYLSKDYQSFRKLMLDRMSVLATNWTERGAADMVVAITEVLAYTADYLSCFQDAVATEAYLGTARRRVSVARHARLIDYVLHEGNNARVWVHFEVAKDTQLDQGVGLATKVQGSPVSVTRGTYLNELMQARPEFFETKHPARLFKNHNRLPFYTWGGATPVLKKGAVRAALSGTYPQLRIGDVLIFEEIKGVETGREEDANPDHRHVVRLSGVTATSDPLGDVAITSIEWSQADALPFDFHVAALVEGQPLADISVALGNIVLADYGRTRSDETLPQVPATGRFRPQLERAGLTYAATYDHAAAKLICAKETLQQDPGKAQPSVRLIEQTGKGEWSAQADFFDSERFTQGFVVEIENDKQALLRFGDGERGKRPSPGTRFKAIYRTGNGAVGNIGADALAHVISAGTAISSVRNPLPACGGINPEPMEQARLLAPHASRSQERCVVPADYVEKIESYPQVRKAVATIHWTGSWNTVFITVDRLGDYPADLEFCRRLREFMEKFRIAGTDMRIDPPRFVPLDVAMSFSILPGYFPSTMEKALEKSFSNVDFPDGGQGYFHPDRFTFGQPVYLSSLMTEAKKIPGVDRVRFSKFQRRGRPPGDELQKGIVAVEPQEMIRLDNNIYAPANGRIEFTLEPALSDVKDTTMLDHRDTKTFAVVEQLSK